MPWRRGTEKGKRENIPPQSMFLSVCVCVCLMFVCCLYSGIIEHTNMGKILIEVDKSPFQMDLQLFTSRVNGWRKSYTIWEYDRHIHYLYFFVIRFSTSAVVLNFFHHQHPPRLFLWLPRVSNSTQFLAQRNLSNDSRIYIYMQLSVPCSDAKHRIFRDSIG